MSSNNNERLKNQILCIKTTCEHCGYMVRDSDWWMEEAEPGIGNAPIAYYACIKCDKEYMDLRIYPY